MPTNDVIARLIPEQGIRAEFDTIYLYKPLGELAEVAYTGSYTDLVDIPALPIVTSVSSSSTDEQIPSAKLFYDTCGNIEALINAL